MKKIFFILLVIKMLISCDYYGQYSYVVENKLNSQNIQVKIFVDRNVEIDSFLIEPSYDKEVLRDGSPLVGRNSDPRDAYNERMNHFDSIFVYRDSVLIDLDFLDRSYWVFEMSGNNTSTYTLKITEDLFEE